MIRLMDLCSKIGSGATPKGGKNAYLGGEYALIRSQNVLHNDFSNKGLAFINDDQAKNLENVSVEKDDVLLNITGDSVARCCNVPKEVLPARVNQHVMIIRTNSNELCPYYLKYYLISRQLQSFLLTLASAGATRNALTKSMIENLEIKNPDITVQKSISSFLRKFDKKIQKNRQENETLEEIAKTLFKSWFIDFDPVRAKAEGRPTGLSKEISDLFPDSFEDSELGAIPIGWSINNISKYLETTMGGTPSRKNIDFWKGEIEWINSGKLNDFPLNSCSEYISEAAVKNSSTKLAKRKSTLVAMVTEIGKDLITFSDGDFYINQSIVAIQPDDLIFPEFVYLYLKAHSKRLYMEQSGGAQQHINKGIVNDFKILLPDKDSLEKFKPYFGDIFTKICLNSKQNTYLQEIRDLLLPKLISGEVTIPDAENLIEEAGI